MTGKTLWALTLTTLLAAACGSSQSGESATASSESAEECDAGIQAQLAGGEGVCLRPDILGFGVMDACAEVASQMGRSRDGNAEMALGEATQQEVVCFAPAP